MTSKQNQSGFALLLFMVVVVGLIIAGFSGILTTSLQQVNEQKSVKNIKVLKEAKEALLSYAVDYAIRDVDLDGNIDLYRMGHLPCPDVTDVNAFPADVEGNSDGSCGVAGANSIGYFPYNTVGMGKIEDAANECLWYVVSGNYKNNPADAFLNWDSLGYLNLVDENDQLKHGTDGYDFPIAFIISPGSSINQNRAEVVDMPNCKANYNLTAYLEGGPNITYPADLPLVAGELWEVLTASSGAALNEVDFNDQVIPIYRDELWNRVQNIGDIASDNSAGVAATSTIEQLTLSLAECIAAYGMANATRLLPYPAPLDLDATDTDPVEYSKNNNYDDDNTIRFGRFPDRVNSSFNPPAIKFVSNTAVPPSYCEGVVTTPYDELFWETWKDNFFYVVSTDFDSASGVPLDSTKCTVNGCITVDGNIDKVAAMVIFSGDSLPGQNQSRTWWWDNATNTAPVDEKAVVSNYLEGNNQISILGGTQPYDSIPAGGNDYTYCIEYDNTLFTLTAIKCSDLDNAL